MLLALLLAQSLPDAVSPLNDRLTMRVPPGTIVRLNDDREARLETTGELKLSIRVYEQLETAGDDLKKDVLDILKTWDRGYAVEAFELKGLRAVSLAPEGDYDPEAPFLFGLFTAREDKTVQHVAIYGPKEGLALAKAIAASVAPGPRALDLKGGLKKLHDGVTLEVPDGYVLARQRSGVSSLVRLVPLGKPRPLVGAYLGRRPRLLHERADPPAQVEEEPGMFLDKVVQWSIWTSGDGLRTAETILPMPESREDLLHVFAAGTSAEDLSALRAILKTMKAEAPK